MYTRGGRTKDEIHSNPFFLLNIPDIQLFKNIKGSGRNQDEPVRKSGRNFRTKQEE